MAARIFRSKTDRWLIIVLAAGIVAELGVIVALAARIREPLMVTALVTASMLLAAFVAWIVIGIRYTVDKETLRIAAGPFRWRIPLEQIVSVERSASPLSSPAGSLDRLLIRYGRNRRIMVSPADRRGFLRAIGRELEAPPK
jgi:hypothetical protein